MLVTTKEKLFCSPVFVNIISNAWQATIFFVNLIIQKLLRMYTVIKIEKLRYAHILNLINKAQLYIRTYT